MKLKLRFFSLFIVLCICGVIGCKLFNDSDDDDDDDEQQTTTTTDSNTSTDSNSSTDNNNSSTTTDTTTTTAKVAQYFWGTWQSMADGKVYVISESTVTSDGSSYAVSSSSDTSLAVSTLGTFTKQSDSVMLNSNIPYFRKGGANLSYTMKVVGFSDSTARAASSSALAGLAGYSVTGTSGTYSSFSSEATSDSEGNVNLTAPVSCDVQTVTVSNGSSNIAVVPGITVETNGSNMGTIPISSAGQYSLKVTGTIPDEEKSDGYLFVNKTYTLTLSISNISSVTSQPSVCYVKAADSRLTVTPTSSSQNLSSGIPISTLKQGAEKTIEVKVELNSLSEGYLDTGLIVTVQNAMTNDTWEDFVPLRFYKGYMPITIYAESTESNSSAALNGFVIYPDGNSEFFSVPELASKTIYVPTFDSENPYKLAFSGATVDGKLSESTEMSYTVAFDTWNKKEVGTSGTEFSAAVKYGESNESEDTAYEVNEDFQAYIADGDIDFYSFYATGSNIVPPENRSTTCTITYSTQYATAPSEQTVDIGTTLSSSHLPTLSYTGYTFAGWYIGSTQITSGYIVTANITLTAKWTQDTSITYVLNGGTNSANNPTSVSVESKTITLANPTRSGYTFGGWYTSSDFSGSAVTQISGSSSQSITLYAKWIVISYTITYYLNGGTNNSDNPTSVSVESETITLASPTKNGYVFDGWYTSSDFSGSAVTQISSSTSQSITLYAKWIVVSYKITYYLNGGTNNSDNPTSYTVEIETITLANPTRSGYTFDGWYKSANFSGSALSQITKGTYGNITLYAKWSKGSGISVNVVENSDITVTQTTLSNGSITFTADAGFDSYSWKLDDVEKSTSSSYTLQKSALSKGYYSLVLEVKKGTKYYSYFAQITVE